MRRAASLGLCLALGLALGWASSASAASVALTSRCLLVPDFAVPQPELCAPGAIIEFTVSVTADAGEMDDRVNGAITYEDAFVNTDVPNSSQAALPGTGWTLVAQTCTTARCQAFRQMNANGPTAVGVTDFVIATVSFVVDPAIPVGTIVHFGWQSAPASQSLDFFGVTSGPGVAYTIINFDYVPEPSTAALLGVGLLGLAARRRT